jgi:hypothetical protein
VGKVLLYFACLGLGYMLAEISLIQRFVFYLADPAYANTIIITVLLVASGTGSLLAGRKGAPPRSAVLVAVAGIVAYSVFFLFGLSPLLRATLGLPLGVRAAMTVVLIAPLGLCLGIPFPTGLSQLSGRGGALVPWAWGVNGALSVSGAVVARVISTSAGFTGDVWGVALLYAVAGVVFVFMGRSGAQGREPGSGLLRRMKGIRTRGSQARPGVTRARSSAILGR